MGQPYPIPGGTATFTEDTEELSVKQQRAIARATRRIRKDAITASKLTIDGKEVDEPADGTDEAMAAADALDDPTKDLLGLPVDLGQDDVDAMWDLGDVMIATLLESWTLDRPLPTTADEVADLPAKLYAALQDAVAEIQKGNKIDVFSVDAVEDPDSPTEA